MEEFELCALNRMISFVNDNFHKQIFLEDIAREGGICRSRCCQIFKKYKNISPKEYLINLRLENSSNQLKSTDLSVLQICYSNGFSHQSYFSQKFLQRYGCAPTEYRKKYSRVISYPTLCSTAEKDLALNVMWQCFSDIVKVNLLTGEYKFLKASYEQDFSFPTIHWRNYEVFVPENFSNNEPEVYFSRRLHGSLHKISSSVDYSYSYLKILDINLTDDSYKIIRTEKNEFPKRNDAKLQLSKWFAEFANSENIYWQDKQNFVNFTDLNNIRTKFLPQTTVSSSISENLHLNYKRLYNGIYIPTVMKIVPFAKENSNDQNALLFIRVQTNHAG